MVDENELGILIIATIATLRRKNKKFGPKQVSKLVIDSAETGLTKENFNECLGQLISNKSINSRGYLSQPKNEINLDDNSNNDDTISHDNTIIHYDNGALKDDFSYYQVKCIKELQNVKDAFLEKLSDIEQNLEKRFKEKDYDKKYERLLNLLEKEKLFLKDIIIRKDKVINILLDNSANRILEHSNYITSKNTEVSTQTEHQTKNNIQISTAGNNHRTITVSEKKKNENHKKFNICQLNSSTCGKTHVNNSNNNEEREPLDQGNRKSESEEIIEQISPKTLHKKDSAHL